MMDYCFPNSFENIDNIFDSHAHFDDSRFESDRDELLSTLKNTQGVVGIINCASDYKSSVFSLQLAKKHDFVYAAVGYHPESVSTDTPDLNALEELLKSGEAVAVGEIGLDYYWNPEQAEIQKHYFKQQIKLASKYNLPIIVHDRDAHADTVEILKEFKPSGVLHCFSGSVEMAKDIVNLGMYIGVGGVLTFKNAKKLPDVVKEIPMDRILLETDAPYMAPEPFRSKTNHSGLIIYVAKKIAEIKNLPVEEVLSITRRNAEKLFLN